MTGCVFFVWPSRNILPSPPNSPARSVSLEADPENRQSDLPMGATIRRLEGGWKEDGLFIPCQVLVWQLCSSTQDHITCQATSLPGLGFDCHFALPTLWMVATPQCGSSLDASPFLLGARNSSRFFWNNCLIKPPPPIILGVCHLFPASTLTGF